LAGARGGGCDLETSSGSCRRALACETLDVAAPKEPVAAQGALGGQFPLSMKDPHHLRRQPEECCCITDRQELGVTLASAKAHLRSIKPPVLRSCKRLVPPA
jgi:hypothetical protein